MNGGSGFFRHVGQSLMDDFAVGNCWGRGRLGRHGSRERVEARSSALAELFLLLGVTGPSRRPFGRRNELGRRLRDIGRCGRALRVAVESG